MPDEHDQSEDPIAAREALIAAHADEIRDAFARDLKTLPAEQTLTDRAVVVFDTRDPLGATLALLQQNPEALGWDEETWKPALAALPHETRIDVANRESLVREIRGIYGDESADELEAIDDGAVVVLAFNGATSRPVSLAHAGKA